MAACPKISSFRARRVTCFHPQELEHLHQPNPTGFWAIEHLIDHSGWTPHDQNLPPYRDLIRQFQDTVRDTTVHVSLKRQILELGWSPAMRQPVRSGPLVRNEYLVAENRILRAKIKSRLQLSDGEKRSLAEIAHRLDQAL